ncbi:IS3 family transposase, partial [Falsihalocynthiibacter sp. BN13B15]
KIVGWEVHDRESSEHAATLIRKAVMAEGCLMRPLVLHADNPPLSGMLSAALFISNFQVGGIGR